MPSPEILPKTSPESGNELFRESVTLFLASVTALYFEPLIIRYLSTEARVFANLKNLPLIASFLGIGLGMILGKPGRKLSAAFPFASLLFFSVIRYAAYLRLPATDISWTYDLSESPALGRVAEVCMRYVSWPWCSVFAHWLLLSSS
jgi:hypothetical protein